MSPDTVVPGNANGSLDGIALKPLTVAFHKPGFIATLQAENQQPFWFQMSAEQRQRAGNPMGPRNPQALNRYTYVQNNPLKWTDPSGHLVEPPQPPQPPLVCPSCGPIIPPDIALDALAWLGNAWDSIRADLAHYAFRNGVAVTYTGLDGTERTLRSRVKENLALRREATRLGQQQSTEANRLLQQFLDGNANPDIGNNRLPGSDIFYLRGREGARVFMRQTGKDSYEILAYADKNNEQRVINLLMEYYVK